MNSFSLVDSSKKELATSLSFDSFPNTISSFELEKNKSGNAVIYFEDKTVNKTKDYIVDSSTISKVKYLKVSSISYTDEAELAKGHVNGDYEDYYLELK